MAYASPAASSRCAFWKLARSRNLWLDPGGASETLATGSTWSAAGPPGAFACLRCRSARGGGRIVLDKRE